MLRKEEDSFLLKIKEAIEKHETVEQLYDTTERFGERNWETVGLWCAKKSVATIVYNCPYTIFNPSIYL